MLWVREKDDDITEASISNDNLDPSSRMDDYRQTRMRRSILTRPLKCMKTYVGHQIGRKGQRYKGSRGIYGWKEERSLKWSGTLSPSKGGNGGT